MNSGVVIAIAGIFFLVFAGGVTYSYKNELEKGGQVANTSAVNETQYLKDKAHRALERTVFMRHEKANLCFFYMDGITKYEFGYGLVPCESIPADLLVK